MKLIVLSGIDGTGKSTLARRIVEDLNLDGVSTGYVYLRTRPTFARPVMAAGRAVWLRGTDPWSDYGGFARRRTAALQRGLLGSAYAATVMLDYFPQAWTRLLLSSRGKRVLIVDRYWIDTVVSDIAVHLGLTLRQTAQLVGAGQRLLPRPLLTLILDAPAKLAFERKADIPDPGYLEERRRYFLSFVESPLTEIIDAAKPMDSAYRAAMRVVDSALSRGTRP